MAIDARGNNLAAVGLPVDGSLAIAPAGTAFPAPTEGASATLTIDQAFRKIGLFTTDGGFAWEMERDGDAIEFFQQGYRIPSGLSNVRLKVKAAQYDDLVREIAYGKKPDANGYLTIDGGGHATQYVIFTEEIFKNGVIRRRVAATASVESAVLDQTTRGEVNGMELTFAIEPSPLLGNEHIGEWLLNPTTAP